MPKELYDPKDILTKCGFYDEISNYKHLTKNTN